MSNPYEVAIHLTAQNGVSSVLAGISKEVLGLNAGVVELQKGFSNLRLGVIGAATAIAGAGILSGMAKIAEHGTKLLDQQDKLQRAGIDYNEVLRLQKNYYDAVGKAVPTSTISGYLKEYNELRSVVGASEAEKVAPWSMKLEAIIANATGKAAEGEGFKMWRAMEMRGTSISDPGGTQKLADALARNVIGSGGKLDAGTYQTLAKRGGVAYAHADPRFLAGPMSVVAADLGGDTAGTAMQTLYMLTSGATAMSSQQGGELSRIGMLDQSKVKHNKGGDFMSAKPGAMIGSELAMRNPYEWVQQILMPHLKEKYGDDTAKISAALAKIGRNRNTIRMLTMFSDPGFLEQINKDLSQWDQAHSVDKSYDDAMMRNPKMIKDAFGKQYESMMESIGAPLMQSAIPVMKAVTEMFNQIGSFANANPEAVKGIGVALVSIGAGLTALGVALIGTAIVGAIGAGGWLVAGIAALAAALAAIHFIPGKKIADAVPNLGDNGLSESPKGVNTGGMRNSQMKIETPPEYENLKKIGEMAMQALETFARDLVAGAKTSLAQIQAAVGLAMKIADKIAEFGLAIKNAIAGALGAIGAAISSGRSVTVPTGRGSTPAPPHPGHATPGQQSRFVPVGGAANSNTQMADVYLDGRKVGRVIERGMVANHRTVTASSGFDGAAQWRGVDVG